MAVLTRYKRSIITLIIIGIVILGGLFVLSLYNDTDVQFTKQKQLLIVNNAHYEVAYQVSNGGIAYIKDKKNEQILTSGNRESSLWWAFLEDGSSINSGTITDFSYEWNQADQQLIFQYKGLLEVEVRSAFTDDNIMVMQASVNNQSNGLLKSFRFPYELKLASDEIEHALLPMLPGVKLSESFFKEHNSYEDQYPGIMFASYLALQTTSGQLAMYDIHREQVATIDIGFKNQVDEANRTGIVHNYKTWLEHDDVWESPDVVIQVGSDYPESIENYRLANKMDEYRPLTEKLGSEQALYYQSPFYKLDIAAIQNESWSSLQPNVIDKMRQQGVIHLVGFQKDGHDQNYPDFIPPDPRWGELEELKTFIQYAHDKGNLVIPYTNFSWWAVNSATMNNLPNPLNIDDIVVKKENNTLMQEDYGPHSGYVMNPSHPFVVERIADEHRKLIDVGFDGIFEDQWGIRNTPYVYNDVIQSGSDRSNSYIEGVREYFRSVTHKMYIEDGFDVLADDSVGFMGSNLLWDQLGYRKNTAMYTDYYPMMGMLARDKVMQYDHNLAAETMTSTKEMLRWNLAMGYNLSVDLYTGTGNPWIDVAGIFQEYVISRYANVLVDNYEQVDEATTRTEIGDYTITANWDELKPVRLDENFTVAKSGAQVVSQDGLVRAGVYTVYNGQQLDGGEHYVVEIRDKDSIKVFQPNSSDTTLVLQQGDGWPHARVTAYQHDGTVVAELPVVEEGGMLKFDYIARIQDSEVGYVLIESSDEPSAIHDVPFKKQIQQVNLALGASMISTTNTADEFKPANANDGDAFTYWESMPNRFPQSITLDLGESKTLSSLVLRLAPLKAWETRNQEIELLVSGDGEQFTTLREARNYEFNPDSDNTLDIDLGQIDTQFIRLTFTANTAWPAAQLSEMEVYE